MPASRPLSRPRRLALDLLVGLANLYLALLIGWALLHLACGDRWWWLFFVNAGAPWLFLPLVAIAPLALAVRRRALRCGAGVALLLGAALLGGELLPAVRPVAAAGPRLSVMSYNVFVDNPTPARAVAAIRAAGADVVALQELTPALAAAIERELAADYPSMLLDPRPGVVGMGLLSRYPLRALGTLPGDGWIGAPQVVALDLAGHEVTVVNVHAIPPLVSFAGSRTEGVRERERQAAAIVALAAERGGPLVALGDFNSTRHHRVYQIVGAALGDAWAARGGPGFTWPAPGSTGLPMPPLTRIDYVFHSRHWAPLAASVGPDGGGSDHLPVVATLALARP